MCVCFIWYVNALTRAHTLMYARLRAGEILYNSTFGGCVSMRFVRSDKLNLLMTFNWIEPGTYCAITMTKVPNKWKIKQKIIRFYKHRIQLDWKLLSQLHLFFCSFSILFTHFVVSFFMNSKDKYFIFKWNKVVVFFSVLLRVIVYMRCDESIHSVFFCVCFVDYVVINSGCKLWFDWAREKKPSRLNPI